MAKTNETFQHMGSPRTDDDQDERDIRKKRRSLAKRKFHRIYNKCKQSIGEEESTSILRELLTDLEKSYTEVEGRTDNFIEILDEDRDGVKIKELQDDMETLYRELYDVKSIYSRKNAKHLETESTKSKQTMGGHSIKVKRLEAPEFNGNIRDYPTFKRDYERHMMAAYGQDPFALRKSLSGEALRTVKGVDDNFSEMFRRLDLKYGRPERQADAVLSEIKKLTQIPEGDDSAFVHAIEIVEICYLDLKKMNLEAEMNTAIMVSEIEKLLPRTQRREWAIQKHRQSTSKNSFETFLNFLLEEKHAIEYMEQDMRSSKSQKGKIHSASGNRNMLDANVSEMSMIRERLDKQEAMLQQVMTEITKPGTANRFQTKRCWYHNTDGHDISECTAFKQLDSKSKFDVVRKNGACFSCLKPGHLSSKCKYRVTCTVNGCEQMHHPTLHIFETQEKSCYSTVNGSNRSDESVLLMLSEVGCNHGKLNTLWDPGANMSLITHKAAREIGLTGKPVTLSLTKVGNNCEQIQSQEYIVPLVDKSGKEWKVHAYGMDQVTADIGVVNVAKVSKLFKGITEADIKRPSGSVDLLIGTDCCVILPEKVAEVNGLQLMKNQFGYCLRGRHELLGTVSKSCHVCIHFASGLVCRNDESDLIIANKQHSIYTELDKFFEIENMGTQCSPKCGGCKCGKCPIGEKEYTIKEERELTLIEKGLKHDTESRTWTVCYPWIKNPNELINNVVAARARLEALEKRLRHNGHNYAAVYSQQIEDMIERKVARKLTKDEIVNYTGPIQYIPHHEILKPNSKTTPLRIVFNSSATFMGQTLNEFWAKGPNIVNDLFAVLTRLRQGKVALVGDISKMYNAVRISELDQHTHRFLWRNMESYRNPDHYVMQAVTFGDRPSGAIAVTALRKTAEMQIETHEEAASVIIKNSYIDDILHSTDTLSKARTLTEEIDDVLAEGNFLVKHWTISGHNCISELETTDFAFEEEKILGMIWEPVQDVFKFRTHLNFSKRSKKVHVERDLRKDDIPDKIPDKLTHRMVLSQLASLFDPLGLISPFILQGKLLMRMISLGSADSAKKCDRSNNGWDDPIDEEMRERWIKFFNDMFDIEMLVFPRCIKPQTLFKNDEKPILVIFSDGSKHAYGACAYIRWKIGWNHYEANIIVAKNRIAPTRQLSIPRLELCGALIGARIRQKLISDMDFEFERIFHIVDSTIVEAQVRKESYGFGTFTATRVAEIQSKTSPDEWWWVPGHLNPSDLTTRATHPYDLGTKSLWQKGPDFLCQPIDEWPILQNCQIEENEIPDTCPIVKVLHIRKSEESMKNNVMLSNVDIDNFRNITKLLRVTCIILRICKNRSFRQNAYKILADELKIAEEEWIRLAQIDIRSDWRTAYQRLGVDLKDGIIIVGSRMAEWLKSTYNRTEFILLPLKSKYAELYMKSIHDENHTGVEQILAKIRSKYWIPGARKFLKLIARKCVVCRKRNKTIHGQVMSSLPKDRLNPSPAFYYTALDLFGPFAIRDSVKKRTHGKAYGVIFTCLTSRAVYLDLTESYSTDSFMLTLRRFISIRGYPRKLRSDVGSQLTAAKKEIADINVNIDWHRVGSFGQNQGMEWEFCKSANAPWENGCCEALIKSVKVCLSSAIGSNVMTFAELQTVMFEVGNYINERPIGFKSSDPNEGSYLCPNDLLLGRASVKVPQGSWSSKECFKVRWKFVQQVVDSFWNRWIRDFFPTLIVRQKWHTSTRNLQVGDIVMVQDSNVIRGQWKLAQICEANVGKDGRVRDVELRYKVIESGCNYKGCVDNKIRRSVHRLVVILPVEEQKPFPGGV